MPYGPTTSPPGLRVIISRDANGIIRRYGDPDTGTVLRKNDALLRLRIDVERGQIVDSFGNSITVRELQVLRTGETFRSTNPFVNVTQTTAATSIPVDQIRPGRNQEIIERLIISGKDGQVHKIDISYGAGKRYDPHAKGSAWRTKVSGAVGAGAGERLSTGDLERAVISKTFVIRTTK